jgi:hypothetical protein
MDKRKEFEKAAENVKEGIKHSAEDLKETASDKIEGFRTAAEKQGEKLRSASKTRLQFGHFEKVRRVKFEIFR